jgi:tetratricopeptide (TPR) repeat protein
MLRHLAFFEELAKADDTDANWRSLSAGLVVLRLVDQWMSASPGDDASWSIGAVRDAVEAIEETTPVRRILLSVVEAIADARPGDIGPVIPRLMAYAKALEYDVRWRLAVDVYASILQYADPVADADVVVTAYVQTATCLRSLGDIDGSLVPSLQAQAVAKAVGDTGGFLSGRISEASAARSRGNYPLAARILDEVIAATEGELYPDVRWRALHARASTAGMSGDFALAIQTLYTALPLAPSERDRERILGDLATGFMELGFLDIARDAYVVVNATTQDRFIRWTSALNLMEIAGLQRSELVFDRYRRELANVEFPPYLQAKYLIIVGSGYRHLGRAELAIPLLAQAIEYSRANGLNHEGFEAEQCLAAARKDLRAPENPQVTSLPSDLAGVADAIRSMVSAAGAGD